ncbi:hypothetical protein [Haloferula sp.]|uniref:TapB family protein n=1 Tax=Haloferula sp. TaxID=2497595 RepID=UPI00329E4368
MIGNRFFPAVWLSLASLTFPAVHAETFHRLALRDLDFEKDQPGLEEALKQTVSATTIGGLRFPAECYLAVVEGEDADRRWSWPQGDLEVVFRIEDKEARNGWLDLYHVQSDSMTFTSTEQFSGFSFTVDPASAEACSADEFEEVKKAHYARLKNQRLSGKAWFRYQAGLNDETTAIDENDSNLSETFEVFSGGRAISENLALDRELILGVEKEGDKARVDLSEIKGVTIKEIDWSERLPDDEVAVDPLSLSIPLDQHAMFFPSLGVMLKLLDRVEKEGSPMLQAFTVRNPFRTLISRYRSQIGLDLPNAAAALLPVKTVALTGGDPFFPLGTDIALLLETEKPEALYQALGAPIEFKAGKKKAEAVEWKAEGIEYLGYQNDDRSFSSHLMRHGNLVAVSNSLNQLKRLAEVGGKRPALGASDEFRFFRHRYPLGSDGTGFVFLSDATIRRWAGPETRIGASRRTRALAAMAESSSRVIEEEKLEDSYEDLLGKVSHEGGRVLSSRYGSMEFLTPVSELGIQTASVAERAAYDRWRTGYESGWSQVFDPIALRIDVKDEQRSLDLTVLPLTVDSDYQEFMNLAGEASLGAKARTIPDDAMLHFSMAVDRKSRMFSEFDQELPGMLPGLKVNPLSWVGNSVSMTLEDGFFWRAAAETDMQFEMLLNIPLVVRIESNSKLKLAAFLTGLRAVAESSAPDLLSWEVKKHGERSYVAVRGDEEDELGSSMAIYYAALPKALLVSLDEDILKRAMDREFAPLEEQTTVPTDMARHLLLDTRPDFLMNYGQLIGEPDLDKQRQKESWRALPVLNDWRRHSPDSDPVDFHRKAYGVDLFCPGGKGYRWNADALTMESVAYGHPSDPKNKGKALPLIGKFGHLRAGMGFAEGGLRLNLNVGPKAVREKESEKEAKGQLLATAAELTPIKEGLTTSFKGTGPDGPESVSYRITEIQTKGDSTSITIEQRYEDQEEVYHSVDHHQLNGPLVYVKGTDEDGHLTYDVPDVELPAELFEGHQETFPFSANSVYEDEEFSGGKMFGETKLTVVGLESIKVPAGEYKNCVRVEALTSTVDVGFFYKDRSTLWYAKGVGMVKYEHTTNGQTTIMELAEISETPAKEGED